MLLGGELYNAPIGPSPQNILDLGTGTGIWAMDMAEYVNGLKGVEGKFDLTKVAHSHQQKVPECAYHRQRH